jgi:hypothetical protein
VGIRGRVWVVAAYGRRRGLYEEVGDVDEFDEVSF